MFFSVMKYLANVCIFPIKSSLGGDALFFFMYFFQQITQNYHKPAAMVMRPCLLLYMVLVVLHHLKKGRKLNEHETRFLFRIPYSDQISLLDAQFKILFNLGFPFNVQQFFLHLMLWAHGHGPWAMGCSTNFNVVRKSGYFVDVNPILSFPFNYMHVLLCEHQKN